MHRFHFRNGTLPDSKIPKRITCGALTSGICGEDEPYEIVIDDKGWAHQEAGILKAELESLIPQIMKIRKSGWKVSVHVFPTRRDDE